MTPQAKLDRCWHSDGNGEHGLILFHIFLHLERDTEMGAAAGFERPAADTFLDMSHAPLPIWIKYFIVNKLPTLKICH